MLLAYSGWVDTAEVFLQRFLDRLDAGHQLAGSLMHLKGNPAIVLGLARGGVEVGSEVANRLCVPLDVLVARKVGAPGNPEYGIGAVAPNGISVIDQNAVDRLGITREELEQITSREVGEVERRLRLYRRDRAPDLGGKIAILVDDGLATGITALAAVRYARSLGPSRIVFAVPVSSEQGRDLIRPEVDEFVTLATPSMFHAVGQFYEDFSQTTDEQVLRLLDRDGATG